jgi:hypothetical protein
MLRKDWDHQPRQMDNMNCIVKSNDQKGSIWLGNIQAACFNIYILHNRELE